LPKERRSLIAAPSSSGSVIGASSPEPGSRFSSRSASAAASSGSKRQHCNVHSGLDDHRSQSNGSHAVVDTLAPAGKLIVSEMLT
jgi:hypothetical protein